jgi:hypothetical protein
LTDQKDRRLGRARAGFQVSTEAISATNKRCSDLVIAGPVLLKQVDRSRCRQRSLSDMSVEKFDKPLLLALILGISQPAYIPDRQRIRQLRVFSELQ